MKKVILITICFLLFFGFSNLYGVTQSENNPPKNTNQKQTNENKETKKNPGKASIPDYQEEVGIILNDDDSYEGYTLFAPKHFTTTYLIDNEGNVLHSWESDYEPGQSVYLLENGNLIRACFTKNKNFGAGGEGGRIEEYDWDSNLVWSFDYSNEEHMIHHDIEILPNGNILGIVWEKKSYSEAIAAGRNPDLLPDGELWPDYIVEIEKDGTDNGNIVWEWHIWDHIIQDFDQSKDNYGIVSNHPELADINYWAETGSPAHANWNHVNSIDYNPDLDQVMISVRGFSEVWIIDHSTTTEEAESSTGGKSGKGGDILYRWGNPQAYKMGTKQDQILFQQHDPQWIEQDLPGEGNIIVFNNGPEREYSTVEEFNIPEQDKNGNYPLSEKGTYLPEESLWTYNPQDQSLFFSGEISGAQRLPNGNTLICSGTKGYFSEVTSENEIVWIYRNPVTDSVSLKKTDYIPNDDRGHGMNGVFKIHRYPVDYEAFEGRDLLPLGPLEK